PYAKRVDPSAIGQGYEFQLAGVHMYTIREYDFDLSRHRRQSRSKHVALRVAAETAGREHGLESALHGRPRVGMRGREAKNTKQGDKNSHLDSGSGMSA